MFKYNIGDTVLYKGKKEWIIGRMYIEKVDSICIEYKPSVQNENVKEDELKELPNDSVEIKDENGILIQKIDCDKIFKLSNISELRCTLDETYVNGEKVDYLIGVKL